MCSVLPTHVIACAEGDELMSTVKPYPKIRIVSEGLARKTKFYDVETGEEILKGCVGAVTWLVDGQNSQVAKCTIELPFVAVDVVGEQSQAQNGE